jgi:hypothetical protein
VSAVSARVKADHIRAKQPLDEQAPRREDKEQFRRRKRDVQKESDAGLGSRAGTRIR